MDVTMHGTPLSSVGEAPKVGEQLPDFKLLNKAGKTLTTADLKGQTTLISVVPDINTSVCSIQTKHFNKDADKIPNIRFVTVSTNTTEQQSNWCAAEGVKKMEMLSDADHTFGNAMGLLIDAKGLDARSIFIVDGNGKILYRELLEELANEPNYQQAIDFLNQL